MEVRKPIEIFLYHICSKKVYNVSKAVKAKKQTEASEPSSSYRHVVSLIGFAMFFFMGVHRMNISVSIVAMVNFSSQHTNATESSNVCLPPANQTTEEKPTEHYDEERKGKFDWSPEIQGYILGSGFVGYITTQFIGGKLSDVFGCKWIIFWGLFISSITTLVTPFASWWNVNILILVQTLRGMAQGVYQPSISVLVTNWVPAIERGFLFGFMLSGNGMGALAGGLISGYLCDVPSAGWPSVFYICGGAGILMSLVITIFLYENPNDHPKISQTELKFILSNQESKVSRRKPNTLWTSIFTSVPVYALAFAYFGQTWAGSHFVTVHPTFLGTILDIPIAQNGLFTSLPFLLQTIFTLTASWISNIANEKGYVGINKIRKFWNFMSCLGYSGCLLGVYFSKCNKIMSISFSFLAMAFTGFGYAGCILVPADMTQTFAGTLTGIVTTFGTSAAFILPFIVGYLTEDMQTMEQWHKVIIISIAVVMTSGLSFCIFGSAEVQNWNFVSEGSSEHEEKQDIKY